MGRIDIKSIEYEDVVESSNKNGLVRRIKCPFCNQIIDFIPFNADLWRHDCSLRYGSVYLLNGYAISGANQYNYVESKEVHDRRKKLGGGGQGDQAR